MNAVSQSILSGVAERLEQLCGELAASVDTMSGFRGLVLGEYDPPAPAAGPTQAGGVTPASSMIDRINTAIDALGRLSNDTSRQIHSIRQLG